MKKANCFIQFRGLPNGTESVARSTKERQNMAQTLCTTQEVLSSLLVYGRITATESCSARIHVQFSYEGLKGRYGGLVRRSSDFKILFHSPCRTQRTIQL